MNTWVKNKWGEERPADLFWNVLVFQLHDSLDRSVVVVEVDGADHLSAFQVTNLHSDFADGVAANELDNLLCGGVAGVHFDRWQLYILEETQNKQGNV